MAFVTIEAQGPTPTVDMVANLLGVAVQDIDAAFGVLAVDPAHNLYSVKVRADRLPTNFRIKKPVDGPFADVPIVPFGSVQPMKK